MVGRARVSGPGVSVAAPDGGLVAFAFRSRRDYGGGLGATVTRVVKGVTAGVGPHRH